LKVVFVMRTPFFLKNFTAGLQELLKRGHEVQVAFSEPLTGRVGEHLAADSAQMLPGVSMAAMPPPAGSRSELASLLATLLDVLRYDHAEYHDAPKLRKRANGKSASRLLVVPLLKLARGVALRVGLERVESILKQCLDHVPPPGALVDWLRAQQADVLLISPLTPIGSEQAAWVLAARRAGIRVVYCMYSWDNLSNKGLLRPQPDLAVVWNATHRDEAVNLHGVSAESVRCTGAQGFDLWFETRPSSDRRSFCERVGLDSSQVFLLYTCSSVFVGGKQEFPFVEGWLEALRNHPDPKVANIGVLIRPHPQFAAAWEAADFSRFGNVVVYPKKGAIPFSGDARFEYYDSIHHSLAIVGINTSAMVEAAIIDRPVMTISDPSYADTQGGTLHFRHLQQYGFLIGSESIEANLGKIARLVRDDAELKAQSHAANLRFVSEYIRPNGIGMPAAPFWADAIEAAVVCEPLARSRSQFAFMLLAHAGLLVCRSANLVEKLFARRRAAANSVGKRVKPIKSGGASKKNKAARPAALSEAVLLANRMKTKVMDSLNNEPPRVKDLARLEGPYAILKSMDDAYAGRGAGPRLLVLGDSVYYRVSKDDTDRRTLSQMLYDRLQESGLDALCLNYSAYHPGVYAALLGALSRMPNRPAKVVLPINLRCFSPQWFLQTDHLFAEEIRIFDAYSPGQVIPEVTRQTNPGAAEAFDAMTVCYPDSPLNTIGQFRLVAKAESRSGYQEAWKARQIAIFHYLHPLAPDHPRLLDAVEMIQRAARMGIKPVVYLTPINHRHGVRVVGERFEQLVAEHVSTLRRALQESAESAGGLFLDWSRAFEDDMFFHPGERTEHLNQAGRLRLAELVQAAITDCQ